MSEITKGDLVMLVRGHSCLVEKIGGIPFTVSLVDIPVTGAEFECTHCHERKYWPTEQYVCGMKDNDIPVSWLKRIPPLAELESTETKEVLHA